MLLTLPYLDMLPARASQVAFIYSCKHSVYCTSTPNTYINSALALDLRFSLTFKLQWNTPPLKSQTYYTVLFLSLDIYPSLTTKDFMVHPSQQGRTLKAKTIFCKTSDTKTNFQCKNQWQKWTLEATASLEKLVWEFFPRWLPEKHEIQEKFFWIFKSDANFNSCRKSASHVLNVCLWKTSISRKL